jgi:hypothetical protein
MNIAATTVKNSVHDKLQAQVNLLDARLKTIKARAEQTKADLQLKAVMQLTPKIEGIHQELRHLKQLNEAAFQQARSSFEKRLHEFEQSLNSVEPPKH